MNKNKVNKKILLIIPAFNEAGIIFNVIKEIKSNTNYDYLVINDCSYDSTELILKDNNLNYVSNIKNLGLSKSMRVGMQYALDNGYDACIQYDGDGQHSLDSIPLMIEKYNQGYEIVLTSRFFDEDKNKKINESKLKKIAWKIFITIFEKKSKMHITDPTCGLRLFNRRFMEQYVQNSKFEVEPSTILYCIMKMDFRVVEIPTVVKERVTGKSTFSSLLKICKYMFVQLRRMLFTTYFWKYHKKQNIKY